MTKTVSVLALAFLTVVALTAADKAQEGPRITAEATTATPTPTPTLQPKPAPIRKYSDQQLQDWAATDAVHAWREFDIELGSDHRFNWFEIGVRIEEATEILIPRHGLSETHHHRDTANCRRQYPEGWVYRYYWILRILFPRVALTGGRRARPTPTSPFVPPPKKNSICVDR